MRKFVAALALLAAAPGAAQPATSPATGPAELLAPNEDARQLFVAAQAHPLTDELLATAFPTTSALGRWVDAMIEHMMSRGEVVRGWQNLGVDEEAVVATLHGGPAENMTEGANEFGPVYGYFVDRPIESVIPSQWVLIGRRGTHSFEGPVEIAISHASPKVIVVERTTSRRHGNAACREQAESLLYADPAVSASTADALAAISAMRFLAAVNPGTLCQIVEDVGQGEYRARFFDAEGHSLPAFDRESPRVRIVPFRPVPGSAAPH